MTIVLPTMTLFNPSHTRYRGNYLKLDWDTVSGTDHLGILCGFCFSVITGFDQPCRRHQRGVSCGKTPALPLRQQRLRVKPGTLSSSGRVHPPLVQSPRLVTPHVEHQNAYPAVLAVSSPVRLHLTALVICTLAAPAAVFGIAARRRVRAW